MILTIHPNNPQIRLITQVTQILKKEGVIAYPTDSGYALGCLLGSKKAYEKICHIRHLDKHHNFTLMMADLSQVSEYAQVDNYAFRLLKKVLPNPYTFILSASKLVPKRLMQEKKKTIGIRVCGNNIVNNILTELGEPIMSVSLILPDTQFYDIDDVASSIENQVALIIDGGDCPPNPTAVIDLSGDSPILVRDGDADTSFL
jgi:tRNA threonylcarbamoyl adenosine modification protein (Sua5/YciO/YrdC/YwlC family)